MEIYGAVYRAKCDVFPCAATLARTPCEKQSSFSVCSGGLFIVSASGLMYTVIHCKWSHVRALAKFGYPVCNQELTVTREVTMDDAL